MFKKKKKFQIPVSAYEYRMILDALMSSREKLMAQGRYTDAYALRVLAGRSYRRIEYHGE